MKKTRTEVVELANAINRDRLKGDILPSDLEKLLDLWGIEVEDEPLDLREAARLLVLTTDCYDANDDELFAARLNVIEALKTKADEDEVTATARRFLNHFDRCLFSGTVQRDYVSLKEELRKAGVKDI